MRKINLFLILSLFLIIESISISASLITDLNVINAWEFNNTFNDSIGTNHGSSATGLSYNWTSANSTGIKASGNPAHVTMGTLNGGSSFTASVEFWIFRSSTGGNWIMDFRQVTTASGTGMIYWDGSGSDMTIYTGTGTKYYNGVASSPASCSIGSWCHFVVTGMTIDTNGNWYLGSAYDGTGRDPNLIFENTRIYSGTLSASNVTSLYTNGRTYDYYTTTSSNVSYFWFNGSSVPETNNSFSQNFMNFSQNATLGNNSYVNCSLILNGVTNETKRYNNSLNTSLFFNINFSKILYTPTQYNYSISCIDSVVGTTLSTSSMFYLDVVFPNFLTTFVNNSWVFRDNLSATFNFSDDFYLHSFNISIDGVQVAGNSSLIGTIFSYNLSSNISNLATGKHILTITTADGHTASKIPDYDVSTGLLNQYLNYGYTGLDGKKKNVKISTDSLMDSFSTEKKFDRYTFDYQPNNQNKPFYEFNVETDESIRIIRDDSTYLKAWIVFGNKWLDFYLPGENASIEISKVTDTNVKIRVSGMKNKNNMKFQSIGDLNIYSVNYTFYKLNATISYYGMVFEGATTTHALVLNASNLSSIDNHAFLRWNNVNYTSNLTLTKTNLSSDAVQYYEVFTASGVNGSSVNWTWFFNVSGYNFNVSGSSTFVVMNITNCSVGSYVVLNYTLYDQESQTIATSNASIKNYLTITNPNDLLSVYNFTILQPSTNLLICLPNGTLNGSSWILDSLTEYTFTDHVIQFHYIDNFNLTSAVIPKNIALYDLKSLDSTSFLVTYQDENYLYVEGVIVDLLRKYVSLNGQFYSVEHGKTDTGGQTRLHFKTEDVIYKANVWKDGSLLYSTGEFQALCQATPCQINLRKPYTNTESASILENIVYSMTDPATFHSGKTITFAFSTKDGTSTNILMNVTKTTSLVNETICSQSTTTSAGSVVCTIPASYYNATYTARVYKDGSFIGLRPYSDEPSSNETFGRTGVFLTALAYLMLAFMGISSPIASIVLGILALISMTAMNLLDGGSAFGIGSTILWLIIAGCILIYKFHSRRVQ